MICSECSAEMPEISAYCPVCGYAVNAASDLFQAKDVADSLLAAVAYVALAPAIVFLLVPAIRSRLFVRFHAWQAILFAGASCVLAGLLRLLFLLFSVIPFGGSLVAWLLLGVGGLAITILWLALVIKAALGQRFELPWIGMWAARLAQ
jgi:uncharacterized membrane protein